MLYQTFNRGAAAEGVCGMRTSSAAAGLSKSKLWNVMCRRE